MPAIHCLLFLGALNLVFIVSNVYGCVSTGVPTCQGLSGCGGYQPLYQPQPAYFPQQQQYYPQQQYQQPYVYQQACCNPCGGFGRRKRATCPYGRKKRQEAEALVKIERKSDAAIQSENSPAQPRVTRDATTFSNNPDERFMQCCAGRGLSAACLNHCTFQTFDKNLLSRMYFHLDGCPLENAADIHFCAAQGKDHSQCCVNQGVGQTLGGQKCLVFCNQVPGYVTKLDMTYLPCYDRFDAMKDCFYNSMITYGKK